MGILMNWRIFRIIIITLSTCISIMSTYYTVPLESTNLPLIEQLKSLLLIFVASLLGLFFIIGIQAFNPYSSKLWVVPSWEINPFTKKATNCVFSFRRMVHYCSIYCSINIQHTLWLFVLVCIIRDCIWSINIYRVKASTNSISF